MIAGCETAKVSSGFIGCTFEHKRHEAIIDGAPFDIYDTAGLNEGEKGRVPHWQAINQLYTLIRTLDGVSLLIYCMRGRIKENTRANWILFTKVLCDRKVPVITVATGMENEEDLEERRLLLGKTLETNGMVPHGVACVVAVRGKRGEHEERYNLSQRQLRHLIMRSYRRQPWSMTTDDWIGHIYKTTYTTKLCLFSDVRVEFAMEATNVVVKFIQETGMRREESEKLKSTLLDAEKKLRRRLPFR